MNMEHCHIPFDAYNEDKLRLLGHVIGAFLLAQTAQTNLFTLRIAILLDIGLGTLEDDTALFLGSLQTDVPSAG